MLYIKLGMTRKEIVGVLGEPDDVGGVTRKYKTPSIYKYGIYEFTFGLQKTDGLCWVGYDDESYDFIKVLG